MSLSIASARVGGVLNTGVCDKTNMIMIGLTSTFICGTMSIAMATARFLASSLATLVFSAASILD